MAQKPIEIFFGNIPKEISIIVAKQFVPNEKPQVVIYNDYRYCYFILTDIRILRVYVVTKYSDIRIESVLYRDIDFIHESSVRNVFVYKVMKQGQAVMSITIDDANELAFKFGKLLYLGVNQAKKMVDNSGQKDTPISDNSSRLKQLEELFKDRLISESEYQAKRAEILRNL